MAFAFEKLIVYQKAVDLADRIAAATEQFPRGGGSRRGRSSGAPMANDYIPRGDDEFNGWLANFVTHANAHLVDF
jgi:hypothetical protein